MGQQYNGEGGGKKDTQGGGEGARARNLFSVRRNDPKQINSVLRTEIKLR